MRKIFMLSFLVLFVLGCTSPISQPTEPEPLAKKAIYMVQYDVTGTGKADIQFICEYAGSTAELKGVDLPWQWNFVSVEGEPVSVEITSLSNSQADIIITYNGRFLRNAFCEGIGAMASAQAVLPALP